MYSGQHVPGMFFWGYIRINSKTTLPSLEYWLGVRWYTMDNIISIHSFVKIDKHEKCIISLQEKVTNNHKEVLAHQKKLKPILEGMEKKK